MTIQARDSGVCSERGERWQPGDLIRAGDCTEEGVPTMWGHATCPTPHDALTVNPGEKVFAEAPATVTFWGVRYPEATLGLPAGHIDWSDDEADAREWLAHEQAASRLVQLVRINGPLVHVP